MKTGHLWPPCPLVVKKEKTGKKPDRHRISRRFAM